ncbi:MULTISPECIES: glycosyltransferase [unclassified Nodularia (in: cyanobacteria)]|uniref:glycosyltransferase family 2 protein n=1 Tax=unclassified Nodularia (in: cyanobacteria) TaxID=2656917 RepID=UPI001880AD1D|nr:MULTISPECIES: glycosyltransferase [unclassified Nodularia (in: cyanobacteria)]MBE9199417.1 glycosyltransferase family 2 protein [Nodularia sp. LEGE 06071]MCC2692915.1 glycosyltransferase family 2 protein [Nodularia sp. LEGE 04288]
MVSISALIPTYKRVDKLENCLQKILSCDPLPSEIIIHIDAGDSETEPFLIAQNYPLVTWISSNTTQGPGGGRNKLIKQAKFPIIAGFDDDSWPLDKNYFAIATELFSLYPQASVITAQEVRPSTFPKQLNNFIKEVNCFQNCACLMRREAFLQTRGYLPLRYAYGMEEADVALQLLDCGWQILESFNLCVFHDTQLEHHNHPSVNAAHIANTALLAYLRYPITYWPLGIVQVFNRMRYAASVGRWKGISQGLSQIPHLLSCYANQRDPVQVHTLELSRKLASKS